MSAQRKEVEDLLRILKEHGIMPTVCDTGDSEGAWEAVTLDNLMCCDEVLMKVRGLRFSGPPLATIRLVHGNEPGYVVNDHTIPNEPAFATALDKAIDKHHGEWSIDGD